jgi:hypothetical protein
MFLLSGCTRCRSVVTTSTDSRSILEKKLPRKIPVDVLQEVLPCGQDTFDGAENAPKRRD